MAHKLYIDNLPLTVTLASLTEFVSKAGTVSSINIVLNQRTGRVEGHAFVEMSTEAEAKTAVAKLNGTVLGENTLTVTHAGPTPRQHIGFSGSSITEERKNR